MTKIAFLGLGVMGYPMAGHLAQAGHEVPVYNRTTAKAKSWVKEYGGDFGKTPSEAAKDAEIVLACVGNDDDLRSVCLGPDGAFSAMSKGSTFIDHTTVSAAVTVPPFVDGLFRRPVSLRQNRGRFVTRLDGQPNLGCCRRLTMKMDQHDHSPSRTSLRTDLAMNKADLRGEI